MTDSTDTAQAIKDGAQDLAHKAQEQVTGAAEDAAESARQTAVEQADTYADAVHDAEQNFDPNSLQAEALRQVSSTIEGFTSQLRDKPVDEMLDDAAVFARRNPLLVLTGAAVLGFAAARFMKASPRRSSTRRGDDPWAGHLYAGPVGEHNSKDAS
ncbi:hypothetical protein [Thalassorhabdomicrobium marinisediminis]|uniref:DUF3618 domain-containing protein n=1 Tax=Thalassorhabdomicrobium marinisediminis TaxID=2170577 RepID=A0A2T7G199_9RHOB|nr:hypothetical protein [Thalassorhabdomicrobium marinisediminis]PVA08191.1 hypothetical protein DC363_01455 [Thalassorhabdomicrobium marinisediminis]